jgi:hypothetical protein
MAASPPRRRLLASLLPYIIELYGEFRGYLDPATILSRASAHLSSLERRMLDQEWSVRSALSDIEGLRVSFEEDGLSLTLEKPLILEVLGQYIRLSMVDEGAHSARLGGGGVLGRGLAYDAVASLPHKNIYLRLDLEAVLDPKDVVEEVRDITPSELWLITSSGGPGAIRLEPVFLSENRVLFGWVRRVPLDRVLNRLLRGRYEVEVRPQAGSVRVFLKELSRHTPTAGL